MRSGQERLLVIGTGMAAGRVVEEITALAPGKYDITMFGAEPHTIYNRILLSDVLAASKSPESIFLYSTEWFESRAVKLVAGTRIEKIDRSRKVVRRADGREENYDKLIIATGSLPLIPPIENINIAGFFLFRGVVQ